MSSHQDYIAALDALLYGIALAQKLDINWREVADAQERAKAEGREKLSDAELQHFIDQARESVDSM